MRNISAQKDSSEFGLKKYYDAENLAPYEQIRDLASLAQYVQGREWQRGGLSKGKVFLLGLLSVTIASCGVANAAPAEHPTIVPTPTQPEIKSMTPVTLQSPDQAQAVLTATPPVPPEAINQQEIVDFVVEELVLPQSLSPSLLVEQPKSTTNSVISPASRMTLDQYAIVPVLGQDGQTGYLSTDKKTYYPQPMAEISSDDGVPLTLNRDAKTTKYEYVSADGKTKLYMPKSLPCNGECVLGVSYNQQNPGVTQIFEMEASTGEIKGVTQAFYTSDKDEVNFGAFDESKWRVELTGPDAIMLGLQEGAEGMVYDPDSRTISIQVGAQVISGDVDDYKNSTEFGFYMSNSQGVFVPTENGWVKAEESKSPSGATRYYVGQRNFVQMHGVMVDVNLVSELNGVVVVSLDNKNYTWDGKEWVIDSLLHPLPEKASEIPKITAEQLVKDAGGTDLTTLTTYLNNLGLEAAKVLPEWRGPRATKLVTGLDGKEGYSLMNVAMDKKAKDAGEVPVETVNVQKIDMKTLELFYPEKIKELEARWGVQLDFLTITRVIHTSVKDETGKFMDIAWTSFTDPTFATGRSGSNPIASTYPKMQGCFGEQANEVGMPEFTTGSSDSDPFNAGLPVEIGLTRDKNMKVTGQSKEGDLWANIGTTWSFGGKELKTPADVLAAQAQLDKAILPMACSTTSVMNQTK